MAMVTDRPIEVRAAQPSDRPDVMALLRESLGWSSDERLEGFFAWKHDDNPFGTSPAWVAVDDGEIVGFRTFMRWEFDGAGGERLRCVRAVDTATRPSHQGRGVFRKLTLHALDDLRADGVAFVFNTPNDKSRPGYLKMGWTLVGRLPVTVRAASPRALVRMLRARVPADRWSVPVGAGRPATEVLAGDGLADLLGSAGAGTGLATRRTPAYLRWRYGFDPLAYRAVALGDDVRQGTAVFRVRGRGAARECALCEVVVPAGEPAARRALARQVARVSGADYVIRVGGRAVDGGGYVRLPSQGPVLTWHPLAPDVAGGRLGDWALTLGDVELF